MAIYFDTDASDSKQGSTDNDLMFGNGGNDTIWGIGGDDFIDGGDGADVLYGGSGSDTVSYANSDTGVVVDLLTGQGGGDKLNSFEHVRGSSYSDRLTGNGDDNKLEGFGNDDTLSGGAGNDTLIGGSREDVLFGGEGADKLQGGDGADVASYRYSLDGVSVNLASGLGTGGDAASDQLSGVESLIGSETGDDSLTGDAGGNSLHGLGGSDILAGGNGNDALFGGGNDDLLQGGVGGDVLSGGNGNDTASYVGSIDSVVVDLTLGQGIGGYAADDELSGIENVFGSDFGDYLIGSAEANLLEGFTGNDGLYGRAGADELFGGFGKDELQGGEGADELKGGAGRDVAAYDESVLGVTVNLAEGSGSGGDAAGDSLVAIEDLIGSLHSDKFIGDGAANVLKGLSGSDTLNGGQGNDTIYGGADRDLMAGVAGADSFDFLALTDSGTTAAARDRINGFTHLSDVIDVAAIDALASTTGNQAFGFIGTGEFSGEGQIRVEQAGADAIVEFNTFGNNGAEMAITLANFNAANLTADDFVL